MVKPAQCIVSFAFGLDRDVLLSLETLHARL